MHILSKRGAKCCRQILGWLHMVRGQPLDTLSFHSILPSSARASMATTFDYLEWLDNERY